MEKKKEADRKQALDAKLAAILDRDDEEEGEEQTQSNYVDLSITFTQLEGGEMLKGVPVVRVYFDNIVQASEK
jgi:hypothetical protein